MAGLSNYLENAIINSTVRGLSFTVPTGVYVALFTADPTDANVTSREVQMSVYPNYARQAINPSGSLADAWTTPVDGVSKNTLTIIYPIQTGVTPVTVTHFGLYDAATGGNLLYHAALSSPKTLAETDSVSFPINGLEVRVA